MVEESRMGGGTCNLQHVQIPGRMGGRGKLMSGSRRSSRTVLHIPIASLSRCPHQEWVAALREGVEWGCGRRRIF